jgi:hypothetical protein
MRQSPVVCASLVQVTTFTYMLNDQSLDVRRQTHERQLLRHLCLHESVGQEWRYSQPVRSMLGVFVGGCALYLKAMTGCNGCLKVVGAVS